MEPCFCISCVSHTHITHCEHQCQTFLGDWITTSQYCRCFSIHQTRVSCPLKRYPLRPVLHFFWHKVLLEFGASFGRSTKVVAVLSSLESAKSKGWNIKNYTKTTWAKWIFKKWSFCFSHSLKVFEQGEEPLNTVSNKVQHTTAPWWPFVALLAW